MRAWAGMTDGQPTPGTDVSLYSDRFLDALRVAAHLHRNQLRTGTDIPYASHVLGVCSIALEFGADEDQAIAALLHDVIEDVEPIEEARAAVATFGPEVLRIVDACTDTGSARSRRGGSGRSATSSARRRDARVLLVSASDKLHNVPRDRRRPASPRARGLGAVQRRRRPARGTTARSSSLSARTRRTSRTWSTSSSVGVVEMERLG